MCNMYSRSQLIIGSDFFLRLQLKYMNLKIFYLGSETRPANQQASCQIQLSIKCSGVRNVMFASRL